MIIPYGTDAPIYHWPFATLGTIIVNTLIFFSLFGMDESQIEFIDDWLILRYGMWNPIQWVTSNYLHGDFMHLLGNMIVLWGLGIIIEGKVGWWKFLAIYNAIGILGCAIEQTLMIFAGEGGSLGASGAIFGVLAIALIWAPANELQCFVMMGMRSFTFDMTVLAYVGISVGIEFLLAMLHLFTITGSEDGEGLALFMCSAVLHLMGAGIGLAIGVGMLKWNMVDCERWDVFNVLKDRHKMSREQLQEELLNSEEGKAKLAQVRETMNTQFRNYLAANEPGAALAVHRRGLLQFPDWRLNEPEHVQLVSSLRKAQRWDDAVQTMVEYLRVHTQRAPLVRLALAQLLVEQLGRPMQAIKVLSKLDASKLPPPQQQTLAALQQRAAKEAEEDPFEATIDGW